VREALRACDRASKKKAARVYIATSSEASETLSFVSRWPDMQLDGVMWCGADVLRTVYTVCVCIDIPCWISVSTLLNTICLDPSIAFRLKESRAVAHGGGIPGPVVHIEAMCVLSHGREFFILCGWRNACFSVFCLFL